MKTATFTLKGDSTEIMVYDQIGRDSFFGDGIDAKQFRDQVKAVKTPVINLRINSPGGSVTESYAMMSALREWKGRVVVDIDGLAASAASLLAMAGSEVRMAENSLLMVHNPWGGATGTAEDMRQAADLLDLVKGQIIDAYDRKSKAGREQVAAWMNAETWFTGQEAVDAGLADSVTGSLAIAACASLPAVAAKLGFKRMPEALTARAWAAWEATERRRALAASL